MSNLIYAPCGNGWMRWFRPSSTCRNCGNEYYPKRSGRVNFCSRECYFELKTKNALPEEERYRRKRIAVNEGNARRAATRRQIKLANREADYCWQCGDDLNDTQMKFCSKICSLMYGRDDIDRSSRACKHCGTVFNPPYGHAGRIYCSDVCTKKHLHMVGKAKRRARIRSLPYEAVDPFKVFAKYNWHCAGCGCATPRELRGTTQDDAPELDHIISLGLGGHHTYANTQCLCRECNQTKGMMMSTSTIIKITNKNVVHRVGREKS